MKGYFADQSKPAAGNTKTGEFLPHKVPRQHPWKHAPDQTLDPFELESKVGRAEYGDVAIEDHIRDNDMFNELLDHLGNDKAPGPDEIPNEVLKNLPPSMKETIHRLFILMWMTGTTPDIWKQSNTTLLHKKNSELLLDNYRPIALANTMYKLWTGLIQKGLSIYAENYDILSSSQEGFREDRNTMRQLHNLMNVLSDAKLCGQNLYMLYIDFSSAFNTIDHDKLLQIMYDLGFPTDAVNVIANLYTNATTKIKLAAGLTDEINIDRGTIQGDTLSPLLFLIFLEPLLRWLHSGGRGYKYGCLKDEAYAEHSSMAYADNLLAITSDVQWLSLQARRIESFTGWAGIKVNCKKCGGTGMLYQYATDRMVDNVLGEDTIRMLQVQLEKVRIQGNSMPFHHPHTEPYTYLGVELTPTMNWSFQLDKMLAKVTERGELLKDSMISARQKLNFIKTSIVPAATYAFPVTYLSHTDIDKLDKLYARICKQTLGLSSSTPTFMVFEDRL